MTTFLYPWDNTLPPDTEVALQGASRIRDFKHSIEERFAVDHSFAADANDGLHKQVTLLESAEPATPPSGQAVVYMQTGETSPTVKLSTGAKHKIGELPVGFVFMSVVATDPATLLGYGTWAVFGTGRMPVAFDAGQTEFNAVRKTGGAKTHTQTTAEMPTHSHSASQAAHSHGLTAMQSGAGNSGTPSGGNGSAGNNAAQTTSVATAISVGNAGSGTAMPILNPYIVVYMWERTA